VAGDVGHALSCTLTATYTLFPTTVSATSSQVTVQASGGGGGGGGGGGAPNIHVTVSASPIPHNVGDTFNYLITVTNPTGGASNDTTLTVNLPSQVSYQGSRVDRGPGCTVNGQTISCNLDFFSPGLSSTVSIGAQVNATGTATLTTSSYSSPQEYNPADSAITYTLTLGSGTTATPPPVTTPPPSATDAAATLELTGLKTILLGHGKPDLDFKLDASKGTKLTVKLLGKRNKLVASWHKTASKGKNILQLTLPPKARHPGKDKLELVEAGTTAVKSFTVTLKA
jgi:hypothetical protein